MCGIVGVVGVSDAAQVLLDSLKRLAYRGYDSAGIVTCDEGQSHCLKRVGKIEALTEAFSNASIPGSVGLGHTRWATHGGVTETNAHPLCNATNRYHVICNGIIENYRDIKKKLVGQSIQFVSQTDTEVIPQLLDSYGDALSLGQKIFKVANELEGSFAFVVMDTHNPNELWGARTGSPLLVAKNGTSSYLASDVPAVLEYSRDVFYLQDREVVRIAPGEVQLFDFKGEELSVTFKHIDFDFEQAEKEGYPHFMLKEIHEQSAAVERTIQLYLKDHQFDFSENIDPHRIKDIEEVIFVACGTAYHAGFVGQYLFEKLNLRARSMMASEFHLFPPPMTEKSLVIAVTQSGETIDTLYALREAKKRGALTLAICNVQGSTIMRESDMSVLMLAGVEIGVASTKAYSTMLAVITLLGPWLAQQLKVISKDFDMHNFVQEVQKVPEKMQEVLNNYDDLKSLVENFSHFDDYFYIARGMNFPSALEGALKLKEITYLHAEGYGAGEMKHGPIALVDEKLLTVAIAPRDGLERKMASNIEEIKARGGKIFIITSKEAQIDESLSDWVLKIPETLSELTVFLTVIPLQILAYEVAISRKCDPDQPRNLAKSVTVE